VGARPQFVKAAVVSRALREIGGIDESLVHTGQHYDSAMSRVFFEELGLQPPTTNLGVSGGGHGQQTGRMLEALECVLRDDRPDWVLVYGDTNSTLAAALAAAKLHIPIAHVEAGLRSFNRAMPEEINRIVADQVADRLFAPTEVAVENLLREGRPHEQVILTGDVMYDATLTFTERAEQQGAILERLSLRDAPYLLATIHRQENVDEPRRLQRILEALNELSREFAIVFPVHPRTQQMAGRHPALAALMAPLRVIDPVGYMDMLVLERHARLILTDSGGVQKEAFFHGVGCVTLRTETEWVELLDAGWNVLAPPTGETDLVGTVRSALADDRSGRTRPVLYGSGDASRKIAEQLRMAS
jgi:UDP-GlcNAc3NAcA epimerase